jgi:hypothetical protein
MLRHRKVMPSREACGHRGCGITTELLNWYSDQYVTATAADNPYC